MPQQDPQNPVISGEDLLQLVREKVPVQALMPLLTPEEQQDFVTTLAADPELSQMAQDLHPLGAVGGNEPDTFWQGFLQSLPGHLGDVALEQDAPANVGGIVGGLVGGTPGAMLGAGGARLAQGYLTGETPGEAIPDAMFQAGLEGLFPLAGKALKGSGRWMTKTAVPIREKLAKEVGGGEAYVDEGVRKIHDLMTEQPGIRLSKKLGGVRGKLRGAGFARQGAVEQAAKEGTEIPTREIEDAAEEFLKPGGVLREHYPFEATDEKARALLKKFKGLTETTQERGTDEIMDQLARDPNFLRMSPVQHAKHLEGLGSEVTKRNLNPREADKLLKNMEYIPSAENAPGVDKVQSTLRRGLSEKMKKLLPKDFEEALKTQHELIPVHKSLARASVSPGRSITPELLVSGGGLRAFGMVPIPRSVTFAGGQLLDRAGRPLLDPTIANILESLTRAGIGELTTTHTPTRRRSPQ